MAPRTLASTWKHIEKLSTVYDGASSPRTGEAEALDTLCRKTNSSRIVDALAALFVQSYQGLEEVSVEFATSSDHAYPDWTTSYSEEEQLVRINPVEVVRFRHGCDESVDVLRQPAGREDFYTYRYQAYLAELRKLPSRHHLFLLLLAEVARVRHITEVEKKGGGVEEIDDEAYMVLLWAFKELETFYRDMNGTSLRADYTISWYESDWFVGKDKGRTRRR
ncbi:MAG: hypothetical protein HN742_19745 [Lentisphaerae bacterium]|jgi:hypothetical protein|nr:hypothetical protein [Lentisphaerota bacterium]MBT4820780.1 hypothetical protein [Lentisphaerota bacterium]MBT5610565.1 hypothetical protein [Lentisphaerota bacterium]MBT7060159.1 hypothetical protein [Lentisphaerota bacterium]MBT7844124.1 hypothetical protein [Lentisphaerota bacterium]